MTQPLTKPASRTAPAPGSVRDRLAPVAQPILRGVAKGLSGGFQAAELWLLDDASRSLRLVTRWELEGSLLAGAASRKARALAEAPADVAALAGGAVVLEDPAEAAGWDLHTAAEAAVCLPVSSDSTIHGVLWLLGETPRVITDEAVELAEVVAGRLALEVERLGNGAADNTERTAPASKRPNAAPATSESEPTPAPTEAPAGFRVAQSLHVAPLEAAAWSAGHTEGLSAAGCWELSDGRLVALAAAAIDSPDSTTATQRSAIEWLMEEAPLVADRAEDAGLLLTLLNRRIQDTPLAGEGLAATVAILDRPEDAEAGLGGRGTYAVAGPTVALSVRAAMTESHAGDLVPLGWTEPQSAYAARPFELAVRQRLVLTAGDPRLTSPLAERRLGDVYRAATADAHREMTAAGCLQRLMSGGLEDVLAAVAVRRL